MEPRSQTARLRQLADRLTAPDPHIPTAVRAGIDPSELKQAIEHFRSVVFPGYFTPQPVEVLLRKFAEIVACQSARACETFHRDGVLDPERFGTKTARLLLEELPELRRRLGTDVKAVFDGDPAAASFEEVILCYPALTAMTHYRLAHALHRLGVPILPRLITEMAHSATGIDIHPGAEIGEYFSIDHGTGVVIGETTTIGEHVKLYQGVTLGAKSFELDEHGNPVKGIKRHPDIGNHVVVYAGATILGGMTHIGDNCVIGGNVWLTHSIEAGRTVLAAEERGTKII